MTVEEAAQLVHELADRRRIRIDREIWWRRNRKTVAHYATHDGLIEQLRQAIGRSMSSSAESPIGGSIPASKLPLCAEALDLYTTITKTSAVFITNAGEQPRSSVEDNLRAGVGVLAKLDPDNQKAWIKTLRQWHHRCSILAGWKGTAFNPRIPCPICNHTGGLRMDLEYRAARCQATAKGKHTDIQVGCLTEWVGEDYTRLHEYVIAQSRGELAQQQAASLHNL